MLVIAISDDMNGRESERYKRMLKSQSLKTTVDCFALIYVRENETRKSEIVLSQSNVTTYLYRSVCASVSSLHERSSVYTHFYNHFTPLYTPLGKETFSLP